jgi:hypothetical protein
MARETGGWRLFAPNEDLMTPRISAASKVAALVAAVAIGTVGVTSPASAQTTQQQKKEAKRQYDNRGRIYYGSGGPNVSYQEGRTRVFVTKRSWLDAGTEVLPGDRKFQDYAFPPEIGYPTFARENNNRPIDRQPLNPPSDLGGYPQRIPLPPY